MADDAHSIADDLLRNGYERWLRLEEAKAEVSDDIKELMAELKGHGFTPKAVRESFRRVRDLNDADKQEHDAIVDLYVASLTRARPAPAHEKTLNNSRSYSEAKGRGFLSGLTDEQKAAALAYDGEDGPVGELTDNQDQIGGNGTDLPVEAATEKQAAGTSRPTISHSPDDLLPVEADTAGGVAPPAPPATLSDPYDPGPIPAFLDRRQPKTREWEDA